MLGALHADAAASRLDSVANTLYIQFFDNRQKKTLCSLSVAPYL